MNRNKSIIITDTYKVAKLTGLNNINLITIIDRIAKRNKKNPACLGFNLDTVPSQNGKGTVTVYKMTEQALILLAERIRDDDKAEKIFKAIEARRKHRG